ncbi:MAG: hypothetical protein ORN29_07345 [Rhodoferax sp.]|nr:hypothetical protein [Rhodoferax sp.]
MMDTRSTGQGSYRTPTVAVLGLHPFAGQTQVFKMIRALAQGGGTLLLVTPDRAFAREKSSQVQFLHQGTIGESGSPERVFSSSRSQRCRHWVAAMGRQAGSAGYYVCMFPNP